MESSRPLSIIPFGAPGSGKSNLLNFLVGQPGFFKSSKNSSSGETKKISFCYAQVIGKSGIKIIQAWDAPGMGDLERSLNAIVEEIKATIGPEMLFDALIMVVKATDYRASA